MPNLNGTNIVSCGGAASYGLNNGAFYYAGDRKATEYTSRQNARLMYIPLLSNQYYASNIVKWQSHNGG
jgi:hypothetical protein